MSLTFEYVLVPQRARPVRRPAPVVEKRPKATNADRTAHSLALGHLVQDMFERGELADMKDAAIRLRHTQSRVSQLVSLTQLAPDIQERVLLGTLTLAEIHLRVALRSADWETQRATIARIEHDHRARNQEVQPPL
ncbi:MAG: hypothetical protein IPJ77_07335 [Planctomycetes bacterium]|nr:hypothetical protein [Planctomycetota bacterium]